MSHGPVEPGWRRGVVVGGAGGVAAAEAGQLVTRVVPAMAEYRSLLEELAQNITAEDLEQLKSACKEDIPSEESEAIATSHHWFAFLEKHSKLDRGETPPGGGPGPPSPSLSLPWSPALVTALLSVCPLVWSPSRSPISFPGPHPGPLIPVLVSIPVPCPGPRPLS